MAHIHNSQHNQKKIVRVQTNTVVFYGHPELSGEEKSKFEFEEKKFSLLLKREVCRRFFLENATFSNKLNFRLLYKFENDQKNFGCVGSCGYAPASVK